MKNRLYLIVLAASTGAVLLYAAVRFGMGGPEAGRILIYSDANRAGPEIRRFITENSRKIQNSPGELLTAFPDIERADVKNNQNGTLEVRLKFKKIIGVRQEGSVFYPLLENGERLGRAYPSRDKAPAGLLVFKGPVCGNAAEVSKIVGSWPELAGKTAYLECVENRRWNIKTTGGGTIMLPENGVQNAVYRIKALGILNKSFGVLDLRGGNSRPPLASGRAE